MLSKVNHSIVKFKEAKNWAENIAQGVKADEGELRFNELGRKRCPHYLDLEPVLICHPSITNIYNTDVSITDAGQKANEKRTKEPASKIKKKLKSAAERVSSFGTTKKTSTTLPSEMDSSAHKNSPIRAKNIWRKKWKLPGEN